MKYCHAIHLIWRYSWLLSFLPINWSYWSLRETSGIQLFREDWKTGLTWPKISKWLVWNIVRQTVANWVLTLHLSELPVWWNSLWQEETKKIKLDPEGGYYGDGVRPPWLCTRLLRVFEGINSLNAYHHRASWKATENFTHQFLLICELFVHRMNSF